MNLIHSTKRMILGLLPLGGIVTGASVSSSAHVAASSITPPIQYVNCRPKLDSGYIQTWGYLWVNGGCFHAHARVYFRLQAYFFGNPVTLFQPWSLYTWADGFGDLNWATNDPQFMSPYMLAAGNQAVWKIICERSVPLVVSASEMIGGTWTNPSNTIPIPNKVQC